MARRSSPMGRWWHSSTKRWCHRATCRAATRRRTMPAPTPPGIAVTPDALLLELLSDELLLACLRCVTSALDLHAAAVSCAAFGRRQLADSSVGCCGLSLAEVVAREHCTSLGVALPEDAVAGSLYCVLRSRRPGVGGVSWIQRLARATLPLGRSFRRSGARISRTPASASAPRRAWRREELLPLPCILPGDFHEPSGADFGAGASISACEELWIADYRNKRLVVSFCDPGGSVAQSGCRIVSVAALGYPASVMLDPREGNAVAVSIHERPYNDDGDGAAAHYVALVHRETGELLRRLSHVPTRDVAGAQEAEVRYPNGLCWLEDVSGCRAVVVADYNNHRALILAADCKQSSDIRPTLSQWQPRSLGVLQNDALVHPSDVATICSSTDGTTGSAVQTVVVCGYGASRLFEFDPASQQLLRTFGHEAPFGLIVALAVHQEELLVADRASRQVWSFMRSGGGGGMQLRCGVLYRGEPGGEGDGQELEGQWPWLGLAAGSRSGDVAVIDCDANEVVLL